MYTRELLNQLHEWRIKETRKPLVLRGARQVGKTTLVKQFSKEFDYFISLNLEKGDADLFRKFDNVGAIWQYLCLKLSQLVKRRLACERQRTSGGLAGLSPI